MQKAMAEAGVASRRACEELITEGRVTVNGTSIEELPAWVDPAEDHIEVDGQPIRKPPRKAAGNGKLYLAVHKPRHVISTTSDPEGRRTIIDVAPLPQGMKGRIYPVGRLDADSTGLMVLTNDGELANRLTHPRYEIKKVYLVSVRGRLTMDDVNKMQDGLILAHRGTGDRKPQTKKAVVSSVELGGYQRDDARGDRTRLRITLEEGQNREIRRLLARLGYKVRRLKRIAIGPLTIKGLAAGQSRMLTAGEVKRLYKSVGLER